MIAIVIFSAVAILMLAMLLARFGPRRHTVHDAGDTRPRMPSAALRALVVELLRAMGLRLGPQADGCLVATQTDALGEIRNVVVLSDEEVVDQAAIVAAGESLRALGGARGMLVAVGEVVTDGLAGLDLPLEIVDRTRLRQLVAEHLPDRLSTLDRYRGFEASKAQLQSESDRWVGEGGAVPHE